MRHFFKVCSFLFCDIYKQRGIIFLAHAVQVMDVQTSGCKNSVTPNKSCPVLDKNIVHHHQI